MSLHPTLAKVTDRIIERSKDSRRRYLDPSVQVMGLESRHEFHNRIKGRQQCRRPNSAKPQKEVHRAQRCPR